MPLIVDTFDRDPTPCGAGGDPGTSDTGQNWQTLSGGVAIYGRELAPCVYSTPALGQRNSSVVTFPSTVEDREVSARVTVSPGLSGGVARAHAGVILGTSLDEATRVDVALVGTVGGVVVRVTPVGIGGLVVTEAATAVAPGDTVTLRARVENGALIVDVGGVELINLALTAPQEAAVHALQRVGVFFQADRDDVNYTTVISDSFDRPSTACPAGGVGVSDTADAWVPFGSALNALFIDNPTLVDGAVGCCGAPTLTTPTQAGVSTIFQTGERRIGADITLGLGRTLARLHYARQPGFASVGLQRDTDGTIFLQLQFTNHPSTNLSVPVDLVPGSTHRVEALFLGERVTAFLDGLIVGAVTLSPAQAAAIDAQTNVGIEFTYDVDGPVGDEGDSRIDNLLVESAALVTAGNDDDGQSRIDFFSADSITTDVVVSPLPTDIVEGDEDHIDHHNTLHDLAALAAAAGFRFSGVDGGPESERPDPADARHMFWDNEDSGLTEFSDGAFWRALGAPGGGTPITTNVDQVYDVHTFYDGDRHPWLTLFFDHPGQDPAFSSGFSGLNVYGLKLIGRGLANTGLLAMYDERDLLEVGPELWRPKLQFNQQSIEFSDGKGPGMFGILELLTSAGNNQNIALGQSFRLGINMGRHHGDQAEFSEVHWQTPVLVFPERGPGENEPNRPFHGPSWLVVDQDNGWHGYSGIIGHGILTLEGAGPIAHVGEAATSDVPTRYGFRMKPTVAGDKLLFARAGGTEARRGSRYVMGFQTDGTTAVPGNDPRLVMTIGERSGQNLGAFVIKPDDVAPPASGNYNRAATDDQNTPELFRFGRGFGMDNILFMFPAGGVPVAPPVGGGGYLRVDAAGQLIYRGPVTQTVVAPA